MPVQVLLGILAQESNLWQASGHALSGVTGNPLIGNFYGRGSTAPDGVQDWNIVWGNADCGYGVSQRTDGMRKAGFARPGEVLLPLASQKAVALDYATNIASGLQLLQDKWNETRAAGLIHSDGDPQWLENWIFAIWAYNSGFHPNPGNGGPWGVGWLNNPANPHYPANRSFFGSLASDLTQPQDWPYTEKVIGFAAFSFGTPDGPGFRPAWWVGTAERNRAKPEIYTFCTAANTCTPGVKFTPNAPEVAGEPAGPCAHKNAAGQYDLKCYWHSPTEFNACATGQCGHELLRFDTTFPEQPEGTHNPPNCSLAGLPTGSLIIDDVPDVVPPVRSNCSHVWTSQGTFGLTFASDVSGLFPSKIDFHQIGGGFGGHFWFAHTRLAGAEAGKLKVTGTWTLNQPITGWARVFVHMPDHGAHTQQAAYVVSLGNGTQKKRFALQRIGAHKWVSLGVMQFSGTPSITLSTETFDGAGRDDIAWDAVAFQKLPAKPRHFVVALGDSYSSGEGASDPAGGDDYYPETDNNGDLADTEGRNACHRSPFAWSRKAFLNDVPAQTIGQRADAYDNTIDYQFHACSGARTFNVIPFRTVGTPKPTALGKQGVGQYGEVSQLDKGYLDANTTLVTISIGGNDARFSAVVTKCVASVTVCQNSPLDTDTQPMTIAVPAQMTNEVKPAIATTLAEIHKKAPNAKIVLMGYPKLFENNGQCIPGIGTEEAPWLNQMGDTMATMMGQAATDATALGTVTRFANPITFFQGQGICGSPVESVHGIVTSLTAGDKRVPPSAQSFHPKISGTTLYANALNAALRAMGL